MRSALIISTATSVGGMERIVCGLSRQLLQQGLRVHTYFPASLSDSDLLEWCAEQGVDAVAHPSVLNAADSHSWHSASALASLVDELQPDVVNLHYGDNFLSIWDVIGVRRAKHRAALVVSIHHPTAWTAKSRKKRLLTGIGSLIADSVTTFSHATYAVLRSAGIPRRKLSLIPCGVAPPDLELDRLEARHRLGLPPQAFVIGALARLVEHKGLDLLLAAVGDPRLTNAHVVIAGEGPLRSQLEAVARDSGLEHVRFMGRLERLDEFFSALDLFCLPSQLEGFGLVYVEAAMRGVPSVALNVGGVSDAVIHGRTGLLVADHDLNGVRHSLIRLKEDEPLRLRLGSAARQRAMTELDEGTMSRRFLELFQRQTTKRRATDRRP